MRDNNKKGYNTDGVEKIRPLLPKKFIDEVRGQINRSRFIQKRKTNKHNSLAINNSKPRNDYKVVAAFLHNSHIDAY